MSEKKFIVKLGEEIIITVARGKKKPASPMGASGVRRKGVIQTRKPDDYLPRRLSGKKYINVYIGNYHKIGGAFQNLNFTNTQEDFDESDYQALYALLLNIGITNFVNVFSFVAPFTEEYLTNGLYPFYMSVFSSDFSYQYSPTDRLNTGEYFNTKWTADGLKLSPEELLDMRIYINNFDIEEVVLSGENQSKITSVPDPEADAVAFTPTAQMDILVVPEILRYEARSRYFDAGGNTETTIEAPTRRLIDFADRLYNKSSPRFLKPYTGFWALTNGNYPMAYQAVLNADALYGLGTASLAANSNAFPPPPGYPPQITEFETGNLIFLQTGTNSWIERVALIIKQGNNIFYVWKD